MAADFFLVLFDMRLIGTFIFCHAHVAHILRAARRGRKAFAPPLLLLPAAALAAGLTVRFFPGADARFADTPVFAVYACLFLTGISVNAVNMKRNVNNLPLINRVLILAGLGMFALCDICVLFYNLPLFVSAGPRLLTLSAAGYALIWVFYAPSQLLLAVSGLLFKHRAGR